MTQPPGGSQPDPWRSGATPGQQGSGGPSALPTSPQPTTPPPNYPPGYPHGGGQYAAYPPPGATPPGFSPAPQGYAHPVGYQGQGYPGQAYSYPYSAAVPPKPGTVRAAAVLAFVQAGIIILLGMATLGGATTLREFDDVIGGTSMTGVLTAMGLLAIAAGGLLIAGGVTALKKKFLLLLLGCGLSLLLSLWWTIQTDSDVDVLIWAVLLAVMPILSISFVVGRTAQVWAKTP